jgi:hypothetical protein
VPRPRPALAATCRDWLVIAEDLRDLGYDVESVRAAVRQAEALATPDERCAVARAMRDLGSDPDAAAAIGPMGLSPHEFAAPGESSLGWPRDAGALFDWLRERVDDGVLTVVAAGDHHHDEERHLAALREIGDTGLVPIPLDWHPREVVSLYQWSEGDAVDHLARAFGCTSLCLAELAPEPLGGGIDATITVLLESCCQLGTEALRCLTGLLVAIADMPTAADVLQAQALLALLQVTARLDSTDPRLEVIAARLLELDASLRQNGYPHPEHGFVLGAVFSHLRVQLARALVAEILAPIPVPAHMPALAAVVAHLTRSG